MQPWIQQLGGYWAYTILAQVRSTGKCPGEHCKRELWKFINLGMYIDPSNPSCPKEISKVLPPFLRLSLRFASFSPPLRSLPQFLSLPQPSSASCLPEARPLIRHERWTRSPRGLGLRQLSRELPGYPLIKLFDSGVTAGLHTNDNATITDKQRNLRTTGSISYTRGFDFYRWIVRKSEDEQYLLSLHR